MRSSALGGAEDDLLAVVERRIAEVKGELRAQIELLETEIRDAKKPSAGKLSVNQVTFEELREMGLTATQSARLIGARETKGGFRNLDELDKLTGISKRALGELKARVKL
ncbi:MAG: helix-hairpin-helix domain-containing protein [Solirubrobacterales bacterium]|nr:helix-hairpin-helix domain-containing protein [Solirubrobacterales bacterium]